MSDIVTTIDGALADYALSDDAMRWSPEPAPPPAPVRTFDVPVVISARLLADQFNTSPDAVMRAAAELMIATYRLQTLHRWRSPNAAERTVSARRRAGSRRTKRYARRGA